MLKAAVIYVSEDLEPRNAGAQKELLKEKEEQSDPIHISYIAYSRWRACCQEKTTKFLKLVPACEQVSNKFGSA